MNRFVKAIARCVTMALGAIAVCGPEVADAKSGDYEIAWQVGPAIAPPPPDFVAGGKSILRAKLLPERLFETVTAVNDASGKLLIPARTQIVLMAHEKFMVCSLERGPDNAASHDSRVCLLDSDGDGAFDRYFLRGFGRALFVTDQMWFVLAGKVGSDLMPIAPSKVLEIDRDKLHDAPGLELFYVKINDKKQSIGLASFIAGFAFSSSCAIGDAATPSASPVCTVAGFDLHILARQGDTLKFEIGPSQTAVDVRFKVSYGIVDRKVVGFYMLPH